MLNVVDPLDALDALNETDTPDAVLEEFNSKFFVVNENGKAIVYAPKRDAVLRRRYHDRLTFGDLRQLYMNRVVVVGADKKGSPVTMPVAEFWLRSPLRHQYVNGVVFAPSAGEARGVLNLWQGFAVTPAPGDWSLLRSHIHSIICDSDPVRFDYLMGWMARMVQHPAEQGEVAVVMKGGEGTGKGTLAKALLKIMGQHGLAISNAKHLVGNFNGHLRDAIMLFADEAFFAGDKQHVGTLKSLITEPYLTVEAKFQNAVQMPNYLHVMMASNEEWVVPASLDARRFLVLVVSEAAKCDHAYFAEIWAQMDASGYEAMLHDLLTMDLTQFNVRAVPETEGLQQQRKLSLPTPEAWWQDCLERGYVFRSKLGLEEHFGQWHEELATELLFASYMEFAGARREWRLMSRENLGKFLQRMGSRPVKARNRPVGEHIVDEPTAFGSHRVAKLIMQARPHGYRVAPLDVARSGFTDATGLDVGWPDAAEDA